MIDHCCKIRYMREGKSPWMWACPSYMHISFINPHLIYQCTSALGITTPRGNHHFLSSLWNFPCVQYIHSCFIFATRATHEHSSPLAFHHVFRKLASMLNTNSGYLRYWADASTGGPMQRLASVRNLGLQHLWNCKGFNYISSASSVIPPGRPLS